MFMTSPFCLKTRNGRVSASVRTDRLNTIICSVLMSLWHHKVVTQVSELNLFTLTRLCICQCHMDRGPLVNLLSTCILIEYSLYLLNICSVYMHCIPGSDPLIMLSDACNAQPPHVRMGALAWKRCIGCGCKISDRFLLFALDGYWHCHCLKCSCCQAQLAEIGSSCFTKRGLILCKSDYIRSD